MDGFITITAIVIVTLPIHVVVIVPLRRRGAADEQHSRQVSCLRCRRRRIGCRLFIPADCRPARCDLRPPPRSRLARRLEIRGQCCLRPLSDAPDPRQAVLRLSKQVSRDRP